MGGPELATQQRLVPESPILFDFSHEPSRVAIELDGGTFGKKSRHNSGAGIEGGYEKANAAQRGQVVRPAVRRKSNEAGHGGHRGRGVGGNSGEGDDAMSVREIQVVSQSEMSMNTFCCGQSPSRRRAGGTQLSEPHCADHMSSQRTDVCAAMVDASACLPITTVDASMGGAYPNVEGVFEGRDWTGLWVAVGPIPRKCTVVEGSHDGDPDAFVPDSFDRHEEIELLGLVVDRELAWPFTLLANCMAKADGNALLFRWNTGRCVLMATQTVRRDRRMSANPKSHRRSSSRSTPVRRRSRRRGRSGWTSTGVGCGRADRRMTARDRFTRGRSKIKSMKPGDRSHAGSVPEGAPEVLGQVSQGHAR